MHLSFVDAKQRKVLPNVHQTGCITVTFEIGGSYLYDSESFSMTSLRDEQMQHA